MWVKGFLNEEAQIGDTVTVTTVNDRKATGTLVAIEPTFSHSFGKFMPEVVAIDKMLRQELFGGDA
jgi:hypothetical protein